MRSRREFLAQASGVALASTLPQVGSPLGRETGGACFNHEVSLEGEWWFRTDPAGSGETCGWYQPQLATADWVRVAVPHTWQIMPGTEEYYGTAWYRRTFETRPERIEFEAVFHSATVWVNGKPAGQHIGKDIPHSRSTSRRFCTGKRPTRSPSRSTTPLAIPCFLGTSRATGHTMAAFTARSGCSIRTACVLSPPTPCSRIPAKTYPRSWIS